MKVLTCLIFVVTGACLICPTNSDSDGRARALMWGNDESVVAATTDFSTTIHADTKTKTDIMSIDLEWSKLDSSLTDTLVGLINRQLESTTRPSFIGPIQVTSFDLGAAAPDVELVDLRDIYRDFLEDDEDEDDHLNADVDGLPAYASASAGPRAGAHAMEDDDDDGFEWVSRRDVRGKGVVGEDAPAYHLLPPHVRYGAAAGAGMGGAGVGGMGMGMGLGGMGLGGMGLGGMGMGMGMDMLHSTPFLRTPRDIWSPAFANLADLRPAYPAAAPPSLYLSALSAASASAASPAALAASRTPHRLGPGDAPSEAFAPSSSSSPPPSRPRSPSADLTPPAPAPAPHPNLQLHLHITWQANLRLTLTTSLLINYPSPMFMSLPIKLSVTGLLFTGEVVVGYEGARRRVHLCIVDELDPYGPLGGAERPRRGGATTPSPASTAASGTPVETPLALALDDDAPPPSATVDPRRAGKPLPIGQRLLPSIDIESEIGQADKHVLKNVGRVERFIQDVIRKTVEEELVFPNFQTFCLGE